MSESNGEKGSVKNVQALLERPGTQRWLAQCLPKHISPERLMKVAPGCIARSPQLQECSAPSLLGCIVQASELGLEIGGPLGQAYIVPYKTVATFQVGYRGLFDLAFRSRKVAAFPMRAVYEKDVFQLDYGTEQKIFHRPAISDRGEATGYYTVIVFRSGFKDFEYMSLEDVQEHRKRYVRNTRKDSPWETAFDQMVLKTTARRLCKRVPVSVELVKAAVLDEYGEEGIDQQLALPDMPAPPSLPTGRESFRTKKDNDVPADPEPPEMGPEEAERQNLFDNLSERIGLTAGPIDLEGLRAEIEQKAEWLGHRPVEELWRLLASREKQLAAGK